MNSINEIIIPNVPSLSLSVKNLEVDLNSTILRSKHFHKEFEIFRIDEGNMIISIDDIQQTVSSGDIIFINSFCIHEIKPISNKCKATYLQIDLQPYINTFFNAENNFLYHYTHMQQSEKFKIFTSHTINDLIDNIDYELNNKQEYYDIQIKAYIYQLIVHLFRYNFIIGKSKQQDKSIDRLLPALNYINTNIDKKIYLDELCILLHLDKYYFCKLFKQAMGTTFTEYVNFARLHKARQLLLSGQASISEIALSCGFSSTQYFNRLFKKQHGFSPSHYKKLFSNSKSKD